MEREDQGKIQTYYIISMLYDLRKAVKYILIADMFAKGRGGRPPCRSAEVNFSQLSGGKNVSEPWFSAFYSYRIFTFLLIFCWSLLTLISVPHIGLSVRLTKVSRIERGAILLLSVLCWV